MDGREMSMAKSSAKSVFFCQNCGYESSKWMGQCPSCHEWNTFVEEKVPDRKVGSARRTTSGNRPVKLNEVSLESASRMTTGIRELDRVLGGGIVQGSLMLIGGDPGIGKSTLLLQVCRNLAANGRTVLYVSGEESVQQIRMRAERIGEIADSMLLLAETDLGAVRETIDEIRPDICVIDSIQTMFSGDVASAPGSVSQVREATGILLMIAKSLNISIFIVGHVHMVDTVLYFEGDRSASYRILRAAKNRFGSTNEIGVFEMRDTGLAEVPNPSEYMLSGKPEGASGSVVSCSLEGTRPLLIEVQALVCRTNFGLPRRTAAGTDYNRVNLLMAVLERRCGLGLGNCDAYINIAGGIRMNEPAVDLAIVLSIASSYKDITIGDKVIAFGEVGLSGEVRAVSRAELRVREAGKLGFDTAIVPSANMRQLKQIEGIRLVPVASVKEAIGFILRT